MTTARVTESAITAGQQIFYRDLFEGSKDFIEVRLIKADEKPKQIFLTYKELLHYTPPTDWNVYIGVFQRGKKRGRAEDCTSTNAIYLDFDGMELTEIQYRIDMAGIPEPSLIVHSGHGYHCYWLLTESAGQEVQPIIKVMQERLNADPKAVDVPRILRVPDTMNLKGEPVQAELINRNGRRTPLKTFETILDIKAQAAPETPSASVKELSAILYNGLNNMAAGVSKGERNFCTGRIVQTLKRLNYTKQEASEIVFQWNTLNQPKKPTNELKKEINVFWHDERYKYDGKEFSEPSLQELNERFINGETEFFDSAEEDSHHYDNELLKPQVFKEISGLTFAALSIVKLAESDGIRREHIADLCKRDKHDRNLKQSLKILQSMGYITIKKKNRINYFVFSEKANYRRGYTAVSKSLHRSFIHGELKEHEYKLMILLELFAFDNKKEVYPSTATLALRSGQSERTIRRNLQQLEHKQFIKVYEQARKRNIRLIYR